MGGENITFIRPVHTVGSYTYTLLQSKQVKSNLSDQRYWSNQKREGSWVTEEQGQDVSRGRDVSQRKGVIGNLPPMEHGEISGEEKLQLIGVCLPSNYFGFYAKFPSCHFTMFIFLPTTTKVFICITNKQTENSSSSNTPTNDNRLTDIYSYHTQSGF